MHGFHPPLDYYLDFDFCEVSRNFENFLVLGFYLGHHLKGHHLEDRLEDRLEDHFNILCRGDFNNFLKSTQKD